VAAPTPLRPDEEVVGAYVPITLAGKQYQLAELPRRANREWQALLSDEVRVTFSDLGDLDSAEEVMAAIAKSAEMQLRLLIEYDRMGAQAWSEVHNKTYEPVLPDYDTLDAIATDGECYRAIKKVTEVSFPFGSDLLGLLPELRPLILNAVSKGVAAATIAMVSLPSSSSAPPSTDGSQTTSNAA
jgi:hypothetical protein